ncbi:Y-box-binding protein 1-like [Contarinia nasturtii]|uniref:Y-box-binding protein 1-like n=1 Tax=Contarinia nasturtii TaxID=265458 RepID=UPI0012D3DA08|nr:Y-box-binding protein 1-like [Contarinia nasturtii]XP_031619921.1 Y-box-binding protein 1-like [Contarinia nasturtii]
MSDLIDRANGQSTTTTAKSNRVSGVVKFYSVQKCYGFIKRDDTKEYVFVHSKSITGKNERRVTRSLAKGEHVEFDVVMSDRSPEAINVTGLKHGPVLGSEYALITMQWHQYDAYKQQLLRIDGISSREKSPRARRFFHRRQPRDMDHSGRNGGIRNDRGFRRRRPAAENVSNQSNQEQNIENSENKQKPRRRYNRNRKSKNNNTTEQSKDDANTESLLTESNLTTLLSELNMGNQTLNTANSTSSESMDFEKINREDTDTNLCGISLTSASSRLAASFNKGN